MNVLYKKNIQNDLSDELFKNPTSEYRAAPFWAWNCRMTDEILTEQIPKLKEMGFGGFHMHSRTGMANEYMSDEFLSLVDGCVKEAKKDGMLAWLYDEDRWPSGAAGGYVTKNPKYRQRHLLFTKKKLPCEFDWDSAAEKDTEWFLAAYDMRLDENGDIAKCRRIGYDDEADNKWYAYLEHTKPDPWFNNLTYADTMNKEAIDKFIEETHEKYKNKLAAEFGKTIPAIFTDEPDFGRKKCLDFTDSENDCIMPWTADFDRSFTEAYGFSVLDRLPEVFWNRCGGEISQTRYLYHNHLVDLFNRAFCDNVGKWCADNGICLTGHVLGEELLRTQADCVGEAMRTYPAFGIPGIDMLCNKVELTTAKQCQSVVHQYGKEGMLSELYGVTDWDFDFRGHKFQGDWQAALGVTVRVPHLSWVSMEGRAKRDYPACINYQSPWYREYKYVEDHFARVNTALTRGEPIVTVGVIHPIESYWIDYGPNESTAAKRAALDDMFVAVTKHLLFGTVDFDFVSEALLPKQYGGAEHGLKVGKMTYGAIIVPGCVTLRSSTLDILKEFSANGGKLIFIGGCPRYVDGAQSDGVRELFDSSVQINCNGYEILGAVEDYRIVSIKNTDGSNTTKLIYNMRSDNNCKWLFIAHGAKGDEKRFGWHSSVNCPDIYNAQETLVSVKGEYKPIVYDTISGEKREVSYEIKNGITLIPYTFYINDSLLLRLEPTDEKVFVAEKADKRHVAQRITLKKAEYKRDEPNVYLLDICEFSLDGGEFEPEEEILRIDNICRGRLNIPPRRSRGAQPWVVQEEKPRHSVTMRFNIKSETDVENVLLAIERPEDMTAEFNGEKLTLEPVGYFTDKVIKTVKLPKLHRGENILIVTAPLAERKNIEWMYLLGEFDVCVNGCEKVITAPTSEIGFGSITNYGMPFYGGNIVYKAEFETLCEGDARIWVHGYRGPLVKAYVDGEDIGVIAYAPYEAIRKSLAPGKHTLELKLFGNRANSFCALHNCNTDDKWCGEDYWYSTDDSWCYEYRLREFGITCGPVIEILK